MFSRLRAFQGGALTWAVTHDPEVDLRGVAVEGEPPPPFAEIRAALTALEAGEHEDVDHMFEAPIRLGQALCGYSHDEPPPVVWTNLERAGRRRGGARAARPPQRTESELTRRLLDAFATQLEPMLRARGWTLGDQDSEFRGGAWWFHRLADGRRQTLRLWWIDHGPALDIEAQFAVAEGPDATDGTVLGGSTRAVREAGAIEGLHLRRRIAALFRPRAAEGRRKTAPPALVDPFDKLIARVEADLAAIEVVLATGEPSPRLEIWRSPPSA